MLLSKPRRKKVQAYMYTHSIFCKAIQETGSVAASGDGIEASEKEETERLSIACHFVHTGICIVCMHYLFRRSKLLKSGFTTIKDTWTKSRGRVEVGEGGWFSWGGVEGWGEKEHNCN